MNQGGIYSCPCHITNHKSLPVPSVQHGLVLQREKIVLQTNQCFQGKPLLRKLGNPAELTVHVWGESTPYRAGGMRKCKACSTPRAEWRHYPVKIQVQSSAASHPGTGVSELHQGDAILPWRSTGQCPQRPHRPVTMETNEWRAVYLRTAILLLTNLSLPVFPPGLPSSVYTPGINDSTAPINYC